MESRIYIQNNMTCSETRLKLYDHTYTQHDWLAVTHTVSGRGILYLARHHASLLWNTQEISPSSCVVYPSPCSLGAQIYPASFAPCQNCQTLYLLFIDWEKNLTLTWLCSTWINWSYRSKHPSKLPRWHRKHVYSAPLVLRLYCIALVD